MRRFGGLVHAIGGFAGDRSGNLAVLFGMVASVLALGVGFAVNVSQLYNAKSSLQGVVDAAVTSTARDLTTGDIKEADANKSVQAFLDANSQAGVLQADRIVLDKLTVDKIAKTVHAEIHVDLGLHFPIFGMGDMKRIAASTTAVYSDKTIEVAMMLDVTGFLGGQDPANPRVRVSIVPYANSVNAGALAGSSVYVEASTSQRKQAPGNGAIQYVSGLTRPDNCATERKGTYQYSDVGPDISMVNRDYLLSFFAWPTGTAACPVAALKPLTADAAALKNVIKNFVASGGTAGHIGVQWTWYMLSENWGSVMNASQRPAKADPKKVAKIAILMTDGEFNLSYFDASTVGEVYNDAGKEPTRTAAKTLCTAMRDKGIEIFTIGFDLNEENAQATLQDCASPDTGKIKHFHQAANGTELNQAFQDIARNIESLALTK